MRLDSAAHFALAGAAIDLQYEVDAATGLVFLADGRGIPLGVWANLDVAIEGVAAAVEPLEMLSAIGDPRCFAAAWRRTSRGIAYLYFLTVVHAHTPAAATRTILRAQAGGVALPLITG